MTMKKVKAVLLVLSVICNVAVWAGNGIKNIPVK